MLQQYSVVLVLTKPLGLEQILLTPRLFLYPLTAVSHIWVVIKMLHFTFSLLKFYYFPGRFDEDGSFIGQYVTVSKNKQRISNELTAAVANGATYVWTIIMNIWYEEEISKYNSVIILVWNPVLERDCW